MADDDSITAARRIEDLHERIAALDDAGLDLLFREARTLRAWQDRPVGEAMLHDLHDLLCLAPTANNACPARFVFVRSPEGKARLKPCLSEGNVEKTMAAPVTAIVAHDLRFFERMPVDNPRMAANFADKEEAAQRFAFRNGSLQGAYMILAARALGLDCGPMSGFSNAKCDAAFFAGTSVRSNFLCNIGYGDASGMPDRAPRFHFDEVCEIV